MKEKTDLDKLKVGARAFLYLDIQPTDFSPIIVKHPFTDSGFVAIRGLDGNIVMTDLLNNLSDKKQWQKQIERQIDTAESACEIFEMVTNSYSLGFLKYTVPYLSAQDLGAICALERPQDDEQLLRFPWSAAQDQRGHADILRFFCQDGQLPIYAPLHA